MKISDYIVEYILSKNIKQGYFLVGGMISPISDACYRKGFKLYTVHHEQAAAFAAEGQAAVTKNLGLAMGTSGPGATNLITGIASSYFDSLPVLFITGQVNTEESNKTKKRRQVGFQEMDIVTIIKSITKYSKHINNPETIAYDLEKAIFMAMDKRMGPVLLDIPINIQGLEIEPEKTSHFINSKEHKELSKKETIKNHLLKQVAQELNSSKRPMILIGHGIKLANAENEARELIDISGIPFVTSLMGTDSIPNTHPHCYGFIGTYAQRYSNFALANADLILVLGARLDYRQIGVQSKSFAPMAKIIHIDIDKTELGEAVKEWLSINADLKEFLAELIPYLIKNRKINEWFGYLDLLKNKYKKIEQKIATNEIEPINAINLISKKYPKNGIITVDVGAHQMWFAHGWKVKDNQQILTNGGLAPMGYSLPAAIGASLSKRKCPVLVITGDGGLQINIQELQTVVRNKLPIKIAVFNNNALGMITQFQIENFHGRAIGSIPNGGYDSPDFVKIAKAYGLSATSANTIKELEGKVDWLMKQKGACLLDIKIPVNYLTLPKSRYTKPVHDMFPLLDREEFDFATKYTKA